MGEPDDESYDDPDEQLTEGELAAQIAWGMTEPGLQQKLDRRRAQMVRLAELNAPAIILANQVRIIGETEADLRGVPRQDVTRELVKAIQERHEPDARPSPVHLLRRALRSWVRRVRGQGRRAVRLVS